MDGHYYNMSGMNPVSGFYPDGQPIYHHERMMHSSDGLIMSEGFTPRLHQLQTMSSETLNSYSDIEDQSRATIPPQSSSRGKRRSIPGPDHVKHRRTRSGCYTCRQRRVKCDEAHPTCERCRKGKRECVYPELATPTSGKRSSSRRGLGEGGSPTSSEEHEEPERLASIPDDEDSPEAASSATLSNSATFFQGPRKSSVASSGSREQSPRPKNAGTETPHGLRKSASRPELGRQHSRQKLKTKNPQNSKWAHLPSHVRWYMNYHREHLTYHHYSMKVDTNDFLKTTFLEIALSYEPLLYAITAFSAYHHTLTKPGGQVQEFLGYYNKSVTLLRESLARTPRHTLATVLTILQLATFEEFLGDWVNLLIHQRAAYHIITELFTPETIMRSETHRKIISWYIRFEIFAGFMSGSATVLGREWHVACADFYSRQARDKPKDLGSLFEEKFAKSRLVATDIAILFAQKQSGVMGDMEFGTEVMQFMMKMDSMQDELENAFKDTRKYVKDFPNAPASDADSVVDGTDPNFLWADELFTWNFILIDFWAIYLLLKSQIAQFNPVVSGEEVVRTAFKVCKMFEALQYCDQNSAAMVLGAQASLGMAATCLPKDDTTIMWCRRKYAAIESYGYNYPMALRKRLTEVWGVDVTSSWLPNNESNLPIVQSIREFLEYRALAPQDDIASDLRDMKGLFRSLALEDAETRDGKSNSTGGTDSDRFELMASTSSFMGDDPFGDSSPEMHSWS